MARFEELEKKYFTPKELKKLHAKGEQLARLSDVRRQRNVTQTELAKVLKIGQAALSQLENQSDAKFSTLRAYVEGLGGRLKLVAEFGDQPVVIGLGVTSKPLLK